MPPDPPDPDELDRTENDGPRPLDPRTDPAVTRPEVAGRRDAFWIRVGPDQTSPSHPPGGRPAIAPTVSDIESELDALDLEVVALPPDATGDERDLQRVVDRYEQLLAARDRDVRDRRARPVVEPSGPLGALLDRIHAALDASGR